MKTFEVVVPNPILGKKVTGAQKDTVDALSNLFNLDIDEKLKQEQKENMEFATEVKSVLTTLNNKTV